MTPYILEERQLNVSQMDVFSRLMMERIIWLRGGVDSESANIIVAQLLYLDSVDSTAPIKLYINSPGGSVYDGLAIYDTMKLIKAPVHTTCVGLAASMGAFLLSCGEPGHRSALKHSRIMIHQPLISGGISGQATDIEITTKQLLKTKEELTKILALNCNQDYEKLKADCERDYWMIGEEAVQYGLIDKIAE